MLDIFEIKEEKHTKNINFSTIFHSYETDDFLIYDKCEDEENDFNYSFNFFFNQVSGYQQREFFYIKAINNLLKQRNFLSLVNQYDNNLIDDEYFSNELEENQQKYVIEVDEKLDFEKIRILSSIIEKLNAELHESDLSELFSIDIFNKKIIFNNLIEE